ncbi:MAG TPA: hypothetical protein VHT68_08735 [Pseudolabrys sp.]|jgi:hypothetical protein|nr:hypothetical protein [Pseudolabrys sp.]
MAKASLRSLGFAALVAAGTLVIPLAALADQISLGATSGSYLYTANGGGLVNVSTNGVSISGTATFDGDSGAYTLGNASFNVGPENTGRFPTSGTQSFSYTSLVDTDHLAGAITWSFLQDGTTTPKFFGSILVSSVTGDAAFAAAFMVGQILNINLTSQALSGGNTLESVAAGARASALVGSGLVSNVPLPGALPLFVTGLGALGLLGWRRKRKAT